MENILLDINIDGDCTNLGSLAVLNILANRGEARMLATTACFNSPLATGCIKAINGFYGHYGVPVGILHRQSATHPTPFMKPVNEEFRRAFPVGEEAEDTVVVMRRVLSAEPDGSVTLVVAGCFASVEALFKSEADGYSELSGLELARKKIKRIVAMAGSFPTYGEHFGENNIIVQIPAAKYVTENWDGELVLSGYEIGIRIRSLLEFRKNGDDKNPLKMMYIINDGDGFLEGNPSWDHTAVMEGVYPSKYFNYAPYGQIEVTDDGLTVWKEKEGGKHTYLLEKMPFDDVAAEINDMIFPLWRKYKADECRTDIKNINDAYEFVGTCSPFKIKKAVLTIPALAPKVVYVIALRGTNQSMDKNDPLGLPVALKSACGRDNIYYALVKDAIKKQIPKGEKLVFLGHSLGGMVCQQLGSDKELKNDYEILNVLTFGSPYVLFRGSRCPLARMADSHDIIAHTCSPAFPLNHILGNVKHENGGYLFDPLGAHCESYLSSGYWVKYDCYGEENGKRYLSF